MGDAQLTLTGTLKSTTPWVLQAMNFAGGEDMAALTDERKAELAATFAANALRMAAQMHGEEATPSDLPMPQALATETDMATDTDMAIRTNLDGQGGAK